MVFLSDKELRRQDFVDNSIQELLEPLNPTEREFYPFLENWKMAFVISLAVFLIGFSG